MELGAWSIIKQTPSLLGLIPMLLYIIIAFRKDSNALLNVVIAVVLGFLMCGCNASTFGSAFGSALSSVMGQVGLLIMLGAALGNLLMEAGVSHTICKWIINALGIRTAKSGMVTLMVCEFLLSTCIGSMTSAAAIAMPIMIPLVAAVGLTPVAVCVGTLLSGLAGMLLAPFAAPNIMAMELTGLSYAEYLLFGAGPYLVFMIISGYFIAMWTQKKSVGSGELYEVSETEKAGSLEITGQMKFATIAFLAAFFGCIAYAIIFKQGMAFTIWVMCFLCAVVAIAAKLGVKKSMAAVENGMSRTATIFVTCVFYQLLMVIMDTTGAFNALGDVFVNMLGGSVNSKSVVLLLGSFIGAFGVNGGASAQMQIIHEMFLPMVQSTGLSMRTWSIALVAGSYVTSVIYPSVTILAPMGLCRTNDFKRTMTAMWISGGLCLVLVVIYSFVMPALVG